MMEHTSVLLKESIALLEIKEDGVYLDGTLGRGGHSLAILKRLKGGTLYAFDLDQTAIIEAKERLKAYPNVHYIHDNFAHLKNYFADNTLDGIILDLGVSSPQFDDKTRGFSYRYDAKLDMRMNLDQELTAYEIVNTYDYASLYRILKDYGEERYAAAIAGNILKKRAIKPLATTFDLVNVIKEALPNYILTKKGHPAKQTFQALRIAVNGELDSLAEFLKSFASVLKPTGNLVIISFHSLEDRLVKNCFQKLSRIVDDKRIPLRPEDVGFADFQLLNHKVIVASEEEVMHNHRAKSAKLRAIKKIKEEG